jgi:hypothetical protein
MAYVYMATLVSCMYAAAADADAAAAAAALAPNLISLVYACETSFRLSRIGKKH